MVKSEIIEALADRLESRIYNTSKFQLRELAKTAVDSLFDELCRALSNGQRIEVRGFGCFSLKKRAAGLIRNPRYNQSLESGERHNVYFRASKDLAARVDKINQQPAIKRPKAKTKISKVA